MIKKTTRPNRYDILKFLAIVFMIIDHLGYFLFPDMIILREIWRRSFPLFLMLIWFNQSSKIWPSLLIPTIIIQLFLRGLNRAGVIVDWQLNILVGIVVVKYLMWYIWKWSDIILLLIFAWSIWAIPYTSEIVEYGSAILASSIYVVLLSRWIPNKSDNTSDIYNFKLNDIVRYVGILLISITILYWFISINSHFPFDDIWWFVVIIWWIIGIISVWILCRDNFSITSLINTRWWNTIKWVNNNAIWVYIIHVILLYMITIGWYYWFK